MILRPAAFVAAIAIITTSLSGEAGFVPQLISQRAVPLEQPSDVRWADDDHVFIADADRGVARLGVSAGEVSWLPGWPTPRGPGQRYVHLAAAEETIVVADFAFALQWRERGAAAGHTQLFEYIADVDVDGDRLLVSGLRRDGDGHLGADGSLAWIGSLRRGEHSLRPLLPFQNRKAIEDCAGFGLGSVRFLSDGSFVIVPGSEPGIYLFGKNGSLQRVWQTQTLRLDIDCDLSREQQTLLATNPLARQEWVNRRRMVDEIVETPDGPLAIVRKVTTTGTHWDGILLGARGTSETPLPIDSPSPWAHISAASRGRHLVFLVADRITRAGGAPPRLLRFEWTKR